MSLTLAEFVARWRSATLSERSAAQSHFIELCQVLQQPTPAAADPTGTSYTFEKGVSKTGGGQGFADVWKRGYFAWEYKGKHKNLDAAYQQLLQYREDLENPPLLVVCDLDRFVVHTNFTGTVKRVYEFALQDLESPLPTPTSSLPGLEVLRAVFTDPERLKPGRTAAQVTERAASEFAKLAESLRKRGAEPERAAHFLMRLLFCLFAEDISLLPAGLFTQLVHRTRSKPEEFTALVQQLFRVMATGGWFGVEKIPYFDGGLFADDYSLDLTTEDLAVLAGAADLDWASVEPAIFGTLFERSLDPGKRAQLGAHYTSKEDILLIVEPVLMEPLRRRWEEVKAKAEALVVKRNNSADRGAFTRQNTALAELLMDFTDELARVRVLDPACGSGNFLYVALKRLLDLEKEVTRFALTNGLSAMQPKCDPSQLYGIELNIYAYELASVVVWIGYLQWLRENGFGYSGNPVLRPLHNILHQDAILSFSESGEPAMREWPEADFVIGNPPFLGGKKLRSGLTDEYVDSLFMVYKDRVPREADLVCYWFERARELIASGKAGRAGLLATQGIRGGANRRVLERIKQTGDIFWAQSDRDWILEGASVHVSMVGFDGGEEEVRFLDGVPVRSINADLTGSLDFTMAYRLKENFNIAFMGDTKGGPFDIPGPVAEAMLNAPVNPNGRPNSDVVKPWVNGLDITGRPRGMWIIDFGVDMSEDEAALYEMPFQYVEQNVKPERLKSTRASNREHWWLHLRPRPALRVAASRLNRYIATARVSKHRLFDWLEAAVLPDSTVVAIAGDTDYLFGILHSKPHELWARRTGTQLREAKSGFRYTSTSTFETFPFPWPPGGESASEPAKLAIEEAARELVEKRDAWLNPPGASEAELRKRTLTNLYNERPTWLQLAHEKLDKAVLYAYGWPQDLPDEEILERLLALNLERASSGGAAGATETSEEEEDLVEA